MSFRLSPRTPVVVRAVGRLAALAVDGSLVVQDTLGSSSLGRSTELDRLQGIEAATRSAHASLVDVARSSFVTPFDRGDIHLLGVHLAQSVSHMEAAVDGGIRHRLDVPPDGTAALVDALVRLAELTAQAVPSLGAADRVSGYPTEARRLIDRAERARRDIMQAVLADRADHLVALRTVAVIEQVVLAVGCFTQLATVVEGIVIKES